MRRPQPPVEAPMRVECEGAPRDLGRDQGVAARDAVRAAADGVGGLRRLLDREHRGASDSAWRRDLRRHFPHQHEWLEGVARGAGVADRSLLRAAIACFEAERDATLVGIETPRGATLWRTPATSAAARGGSSLRRVRPEGRFASVELASPLLPAPWIGVNEAGLAVAATGGRAPGRFSVPAALLARDCLERFETVESSLAWCLLRPAASGASILLADASGEIAGVELLGSGRSVRRPEDGVLVLGRLRAGEIAKQLVGADDPEAALGRVLPGAGSGAARVDVGARRLLVAGEEIAA